MTIVHLADNVSVLDRGAHALAQLRADATLCGWTELEPEDARIVDASAALPGTITGFVDSTGQWRGFRVRRSGLTDEF